MSKEIIKNKNIIILGVSGGGRKPRNLMHLANQIHNKGIVEKSKKVYDRKKDKETLRKDLTKY